MQARKYRAHLTMQLRMNAERYRPLGQDTTDNVPAQDPRFVATQTEIIKSTKVLYQVIDDQDLTHKWASEGSPLPREVAYYKLASMLDLKQVRGTDLLELDVTSTNPAEALSLINAVQNSYAESVKMDEHETWTLA